MDCLNKNEYVYVCVLFNCNSLVTQISEYLNFACYLDFKTDWPLEFQLLELQLYLYKVVTRDAPDFICGSIPVGLAFQQVWPNPAIEIFDWIW